MILIFRGLTVFHPLVQLILPGGLEILWYNGSMT